jgi:hypothetical protein
MTRTASGGEAACIGGCAVAFSFGQAGTTVDPRRPQARGWALRAALRPMKLQQGGDKRAGVGQRLAGTESGHTEGCVMADVKEACALPEALAQS